MTKPEKQRFQALFPRMDVDNVVVTGDVSRQYNCLAWTVGVTTRWLWPGPALVDFDRFYRAYGFERATNGAIAAWGHASSSMTHGCVKGANHGPRWESKCGADLRIQHGLNEMVSSAYGRVVAFYRAHVSTAKTDELDVMPNSVGKMMQGK